MKIKPSKYIKHIYPWNKYQTALQKIDILDVHPFDATDIVTRWNISPQIKKIYTLHGEASLAEDLDFLQNFDRIYTVSELLRPYIEKFYPQLKDKFFLSKNRYVIPDYTSMQNTGKNILFSVTNTQDKDFIQNIIDIIPHQYDIHIIGHFASDSFFRKNGKIIYHGFVNIFDLFKQNHFNMTFTRGGFAAMDTITRNIPCLCISSNNNGLYFETLSRNNFSKMSDCNFVTRKKFNSQNIIDDIKRIEKFPSKYQCSDLLKQYNNIEDMLDLYNDL